MGKAAENETEEKTDKSPEVTEADTDIEHVLKRQAAEKQKQRDKNFWLYR